MLKSATVTAMIGVIAAPLIYAQVTNTFPTNGNVGIGTTGPWEPLTVVGPLNSTQQGTINILAYKIAGSSSWANQNLIGHWFTGSQDAISIQVPGNTANSAQMVMLSNGNVGVGTTSPAGALHLSRPAAGTVGPAIFLDNFAGQANDGSAIVDYESESSLPYRGALNWTIATSGVATFAIANGTSASLSGLTTRFLVDQSGNVGIGTTSPGAKLEVNGNIAITSGSGASITFADGTTQTTAYTGVSCGGDFAESVNVIGNRRHYEPGDLLVIDPNRPEDFREASQPYSTLVAGIYSTKPGYVGRRLTGPKSSDEVPLAMVGIVPLRVSAENGPIHTGDPLVAFSTPGRAMRGTDHTRLTEAVVGKALGRLDAGSGTIEALVTLQ